jgi:oligopeptide/dipeptide ABC transporter ATP-binding protein
MPEGDGYMQGIGTHAEKDIGYASCSLLADGKMNDGVILEVRDIKKYFPCRTAWFAGTRSFVYAVDGVSFSLKRGEVLGIVGESGCGKSTLARVILRLIEPTSGNIFFEGQNISKINKKNMVSLRKQMQLIFQDPYASLNPKLPVRYLVGEGLLVHKLCDPKEIEERVAAVLEKVGIKPDQMNRFPHEFSGGQRQRIAVARALVLMPKLIIGDEPVSALDVSIQAQIINLLQSLQKEFNLSFIIISHNLNVVKHVSDQVAVMYLGRIIEKAPHQELYLNPLHPYTQALLSAIPTPRTKGVKNRIILEGDVPSPMEPPPGCSFHTRCTLAGEKCSEISPDLRDVGHDHFVACHHVV